MSAYAQVRIREPGGERSFGETMTIGGAGADIVVPGAAAGAAVRILRQDGLWLACPVDPAARLDGQPLSAACELATDDVLGVGDAQVCVISVSRTLLCLVVCHDVGNATVAPADALFGIPIDGADDELVIEPVASSASAVGHPGDGAESSRAPGSFTAAALRRKRNRVAKWLTTGLAAMLAGAAILAQLHPVVVDVWPEDARVRVPGTWVALHAGSRLLMFSGLHHLLAQRNGYLPARQDVSVGNAPTTVHLRLVKLPGRLRVETPGVVASISIDGAEAGQAPGSIELSPGQHTVVLRAPHYVDAIQNIDIEGGGTQQRLAVKLLPAWGTMQISTSAARANVTVDGIDRGTAPVVVSAPSGVHQLQISAAGAKTWESSVVLKAGEALMVGPVALGAPDAHLRITSAPTGAQVAIAGSLRGRTPLDLDLASGIGYEVDLSLPGFAPWMQSVFAAAGQRIALQARLDPMTAHLTIEGQPEDAQLVVDGVLRGQTPLSLDLTALEHHIEVRKSGWTMFATAFTPTTGLDHVINYRLIPAGSTDELAASVIYTQTGYALKLVGAIPAAIDLGSRSSRPPRAGQSRNTLAPRPYYLGIAEVSNDQFHRYRPGHGLDSQQHRAPDDERQPVTGVSWNTAVEYCNWLSERDSLTPAYERQGDTYVLRAPTTIGYRLPSETEWDFAARSGLGGMSGSVLEWMNDVYADAPAGVAGERHVVRGANWIADAAGRSDLGWREGRDYGDPRLGFRVARYAQ